MQSSTMLGTPIAPASRAAVNSDRSVVMILVLSGTAALAGRGPALIALVKLSVMVPPFSGWTRRVDS